MAGTYTKSEKTVMGNKIVFFYTVTNYTNSETLTVEGLSKIDIVIPQIAATADKTAAWSVAGNVITFVTSADSYDGVMMVIGR